MSEELPAHSPLGPSSADRWIHCPGSVLATKDLPDTDSEYALEGTAAHTLAERCRKDNLPAKHFIGDKIFVELVDKTSKAIEVTKEMADGVQSFIDYLNALPGDDYNESRLFYTEYVKDGFGTMDAAKATTKHVSIVDLKFGKGVQVYAKDNSQLKLYALAFWLTWGWMYDIEEFTLVVHQPRLDHVDEWEIGLPDLLKWADEVVRPAAIAALTPGGAFVPGDWCKFCKIKRTCAARAKYVFEFNIDELDDLDGALAADFPARVTLTTEQITQALKRKAHVTSWYSDIEAYVMSELRQGRAIGGWKLVHGRASRVWAKSPGEIERAFIAQGLDEGLHAKLYGPPEIVSPSKAEGIFGKRLFAPATAKKESGPLASLIDKPLGRPVLVSEDDPRAAIEISALSGVDEMEILDEVD